MTKFRYIILLLIGIPLFIILIWFFAIPNNLIKYKIEDFISNSGRSKISASIEGLRKGPPFTVYIKSLDLKIDKTLALKITDLSTRFNPLYLIKRQLVFSIKGKIGTGDINGSFKLPEGGNLKIKKVEITTIPYISSWGIKSNNGFISATFNLKNDIIYGKFEILDLNIENSTNIILPLLNSFHKIRGAFTLKGDILKVESISLEGEKGYARIKGEITEGLVNLVLELMPSAGKLKPFELMLIKKYEVSPGYYVIPIKRQLTLHSIATFFRDET